MYQAIVFLPLIGCLIAGLFGRIIGARPAELVTTLLLFASAALSWYAFARVGFGHIDERIVLFPWIQSGDFKVDWVIRVDTLTAVMLVVVTTVSSLVHLYSIGYMHEDPHRQRFFAYLSLFTFAMLALVTADNLAQLFFGWEGVGLASYLLIGFWYQKPEANAAAIKAFVVNRVGDFGFALGIFALFMMTGAIDFDTIFAQAPALTGKTIDFFGWHADALTLICLMLFMGAMGKSAQFLLHTWLPDAMEGPTPVSALIHAATMVTAGVFMVARLSPLFELAPVALMVVTLIGATTAMFAATVGLVQNDIKRIIAYSTCSQLGYMFVAMGVGAWSVGMYHLFTHAFFKALLFLGSGSVIHAMHHEQDIRHMGGLKNKIPLTYWLMIIGTLALTGFPFTAGYFSKDAIIEAAYAGKNPFAVYGFACTVLAAALTSFYSWRLIFKTFHGEPHDRHHYEEAHESPMVMLVPLMVLAAGSILAGYPFYEYFAGHHVEEFFRNSLAFSKTNTILEDMHHVPALVVWTPTVMMVLGFAIAYLFYIRDPRIPVEMARNHQLLYRFLLNKWYFDELYDLIFVRPAKWLGTTLWKRGDGWLIDGFGPDGVSARVLDVTRNVVRLQTGYLYHYAFAMLIGAAALITWFMFAGAH
ncbi:NADH-quinone oxidoreductase subunit L [Pseudorhodoplanes sinuspersici]|uniref:NADH-quinone oxidoreductase subunit L n=1 Tax=Pseudorhodoplanes sinuspersici TaxID=1235591 RepID=A0A1W6ZY01_9HYPH|nr:NADH-quinone oxidoreductase subunit L [Pseudorhodoplanes sinuspersici]ARQ01625.1 NADH-quinone oxidoreductase subunit L [Pseudorhodoplanes sinuspersici]RKE73342.1 NADH dehydrogenase subunit L [Pseudorhodoplanes sinuspersici]